MLESIITSTTGESFTLTNTLIIITSSILLGIVISLAYLKTHKKDGYIPSFIISLIMFIGRLGPMTIATIWYFKEPSNACYSEETVIIG